MTTAPAPEGLFLLHGAAVRVRAASAPLLHAATETLAYKGARLLPAAPGATPPADPAFDLDLRDAVPAWRPPPDARPVGAFDDVDVYLADGAMIAHGPGVHAAVPLGGRTATVAYAAPVDEERAPPLPLFRALAFALTTLLRAEGWIGLHAGALCRRGRGVLLVAGSDSGKSTATLALVRQGWPYVSDDALLLRADADAVAGLAFRRDFCLDPDAARLFPELAARRWPPSLSDPGKWRVDGEALFPGQHVARCAPALLLFPSIRPAPDSRLLPLARREAFQRLMVHTSLGMIPRPDVLQAHMRLVARLLDQAPARRLEAGRDVLDAPERFAALIDDALGA